MTGAEQLEIPVARSARVGRGATFVAIPGAHVLLFALFPDRWAHSCRCRMRYNQTNHRCLITVYIIPMPLCRIGKIPVRGDLSEHMEGAAAPPDPKVP